MRTFTKVASICMAVALSATVSSAMDDVKRAYLDGITDTIKLFSAKKDLASKRVVLNGYAIVADVSKIPLSEIVKYEILGVKLGLNPILIDDNRLVFGVFDRKADAKAQLGAISQYSLAVKPKIVHYKDKVAVSTPVLKRFIPRVGVLVVEKEGGYAYGNEAHTHNGSRCNVVNKVLTVNAFVRKYGGSIKRLARSAHYAAKHNKIVKKVQRNIDSGYKENVWNYNFTKLARAIQSNGAIKGDTLYLFGKRYKIGSRISKDYRIAFIAEGNGVVVLQNVHKSSDMKKVNVAKKG